MNEAINLLKKTDAGTFFGNTQLKTAKYASPIEATVAGIDELRTIPKK